MYWYILTTDAVTDSDRLIDDVCTGTGNNVDQGVFLAIHKADRHMNLSRTYQIGKTENVQEDEESSF